MEATTPRSKRPDTPRPTTPPSPILPRATSGPNLESSSPSKVTQDNLNSAFLATPVSFRPSTSQQQKPTVLMPPSQDSSKKSPTTSWISSENKPTPAKRKHFAYKGSPVRTKKGKAALFGTTCSRCEEFFKAENLDPDHLAELLKRCSKHRSTTPNPPPNSPEYPWKLHISSDEDQETPPGSPLKTRAWRKAQKKKLEF